MSQVGIFFGTDTGNTRKVAKWIHKALNDEQVAKPVNINRVSLDDLMGYDALILGTPTLGDGELPGLDAQAETESWQEFVDQNMDDADFSGKKIAMFGLGDQMGYADEFVDALGELYDIFSDAGATMIGSWSSAGYEFTSSGALDDESKEFVGLVIDQDNQADLTQERINQWVAKIKPELGL